jgi:hypothetical protein
MGRYTLQNSIHYNAEHNWILTEVRLFDEQQGTMVDAQLHIVDCSTGKLVEDDIDDVWSYDWVCIKE